MTQTQLRGRGRSRSLALWLLLIPPLALFYPPLYNQTDPTLLGIPFFYWYQLAMIPVSVACATVVYLATRAPESSEGEGEGEAADRSDAPGSWR
ncbi:MAG: DUF3311 domain-containing protein [Nocardioides sp.]